MNGKLVVIDGIDGSGKSTQIELLKKYLTDKNIPFEIVSFPQYGKNEYAEKIHDYLSGKLGKLNEVNPHEIAKLYAEDRKTVRDLIKGWLEDGKLVIANRYISASKAHLGANLAEGGRQEFMKWIDKLEYETNEMPKEDLTILLNVDPKVGQKNSQEKNHPDLHEDNLKHLENARKIYLELSQEEENWVVVECMRDGNMRVPEDINQEIANIINGII